MTSSTLPNRPSSVSARPRPLRRRRKAFVGVGLSVLALILSASPALAVTGWSGPTRVIRQNYPLSPSLVLDGSGWAHVAYWRQDPAPGGRYSGIFYATNRGGAWSAQRVTTGDSFYARPSIALDSAGKVHIAFARACLSCDPITSSIYIATNRTGDWITTRRTAGPEDLAPSLQIAGGHVHLAWERRNTYTYRSPGIYHWTNRSGSWVTTWLVSSYGKCPYDAFPSLRLDSTGRVHIAYEAAFSTRGCSALSAGIRLVTNRTGSWVVSAITSNPNDSMPGLALDRYDKPHLVFQRSGTGTHYARLLSGGWSTPYLVAAGDDAALALDAAGKAHVVYETPRVTHATNRTGSWVRTALTTYGIDDGTASGARVAVSASGKARVVFARSEGATEDSLGLYHVAQS